jgi:hypothetical protein
VWEQVLARILARRMWTQVLGGVPARVLAWGQVLARVLGWRMFVLGEMLARGLMRWWVLALGEVVVARGWVLAVGGFARTKGWMGRG